MKKTIIITVFVSVLAVLTAAFLCSCAPSTESPAESAAPGVNETAGEATAEEATPAPTEAPTDTPAPTEEPTPTPVPTADPTIEKGVNVALTADIEDVSSTTGDTHVQWGWSYEFINDGIIYDTTLEQPSLGWTTDVGVNQDDPDREEWMIFKLEKYTLIDTVNVCPTIGGSCFPVDFHIEVSLDGKNYTTVASAEGCKNAKTGSAKPVVLTFDAVTAGYVKFVATKLYDVPSGVDGILMQIGEIEIIAA